MMQDFAEEENKQKPLLPAIDINALRNDTTRHLVEALPGIKKKRNTYSFAELSKIKGERQEFVLDQLLPKASVTILMGEDGVGKSQLCAQLCLHVAMGMTSFCGLSLVGKNSECLFVGTEDAKQKFANAITTQAALIDPNHDPEQVPVFFTEASMFDDFKELKDEMDELIAEHKFEVVVVDTMSDMFGLLNGEINSSDHARKILSYFQSIADKTKAAVIMIHHVAKSKMVQKRNEGKLFIEKNDSQGAGAITQKARTVLALTNEPSSINQEGTEYFNYLHVVKANLMGRNWVVNAIQLLFSTQTLLHKHNGFVDIFEKENQGLRDAGNNQPVQVERTVGGQSRKLPPQEIPDGDHWKKLKEIFREEEPLEYKEIVKRICLAYDIGQTKAQSKDGYLPYLCSRGWVAKTGNLYQWQQFMAVSSGDDEDAPF